MCLGLPNRRGEIDARSPLQLNAPFGYLARLPVFHIGEAGSKPAGSANMAGSFSDRTTPFEGVYVGPIPTSGAKFSGRFAMPDY